MEKNGKRKVAIVGSGMAGLATAYLLHRDAKQRYAVTVFEEVTFAYMLSYTSITEYRIQSSTLSLDSASVSIASSSSPTGFDRIDLPMRAFAGGYYSKLKAMYDHLGLEYRAQSFLFIFSTMPNLRSGFETDASKPYFIHSSNNHRLPPLKPCGMPLNEWLLELLYLLFFYTYFTICCLVVQPMSGDDDETLRQYLARIRVPQHFTTVYILPLMSSVTTCTHAELLNFPACDVIDYKKRTRGKQHYTLIHGVHSVQEKLSEGLDTKFCARVLSIEPQTSGKVSLQWRCGKNTPVTEDFDEVVLAVAPNVVGNIFERLRTNMANIPTVKVESTLHTDDSAIRKQQLALGQDSRSKAQPIFLRTDVNNGRTESIHVQSSGVLVTTCPFVPINRLHLKREPAIFTRVLRTPKSRWIVNNIFSGTTIHEKSGKAWRNGDNSVWLVGGWCWDGMVLLEGCIVSAIRVAVDLGVEVPF
jgi:hypothetical protein